MIDSMMANQISGEAIIMAALSTLRPPQLSDLTNSISALFHRRHRRLSFLLSSPILFSITLRHLHSLSLHHKSLLIARHLLYNLTVLKNSMQGAAASQLYSSGSMKLRDLDAVLLLLLLCELHQHNGRELLETPPSQWRILLCNHVCRNILNLSGFGGFSTFEVLNEYIEMVVKCSNFVNVIMGRGGDLGLGKAGTGVAAAAAAVVALPSVEVCAGGECAICKEEMKEGREVCELPCGHYFHWMCILRWLRKRNTCPCCRYRLPTDDVLREIDRIFEDLARIAGGGDGGCFCT